MWLNKQFLTIVLLVLGSFASIAQPKQFFNGEEVYAIGQIANKTVVSTVKGLFILDNGNVQQLNTQIKDDVVTSIAHFNELIIAGTFNGNIWVIDQAGKSKKYKLPDVENLKSYLINGIQVYQNHVWIATLEGVVFDFDVQNGIFKPHLLKTYNGKYLLNIKSIAADSKNNLWVNAQDRIYFLSTMYSGDEQVFQFIGSRNYDEPALQISYLKNKMIVFAKRKKKIEAYKGEVEKGFIDATQSNLEIPKAIEKQNNVLICSTDDVLGVVSNEIYILKNESWTTIELPNKLKQTDVTSVQILANSIYIGTNEGLYILKI